jgi:hypothetical protein
MLCTEVKQNKWKSEGNQDKCHAKKKINCVGVRRKMRELSCPEMKYSKT